MAKKKKSGSNIGLILTLIFFVMATFIAGTVAYLGYSEQEQLKSEAEKAKKSAETARAETREEKVRRVMLRIALGIEEAEDRKLLVSELTPMRVTISDELDRMKRGIQPVVPEVPNPKDPEKKLISAFNWPVLAMNPTQIQEKSDAGGLDPENYKADPWISPLLTLPTMIGIYKTKAENAENSRLVAVTESEKFKKISEQANVAQGVEKKVFDDARMAINAEKTAFFAKQEADFRKIADDHKNDGAKAANQIKDIKADSLALNERYAVLEKEKRSVDALLEKEKNQSGAISRLNAAGFDYFNLEEKKGEIVRREGAGEATTSPLTAEFPGNGSAKARDNSFVTIDLGSNKKLRPQVTFLVVAADVSWLALMEKEDSLKKNSYRNDRQPFEDNPYVKAGIEVVEILGADRARAKIIFENEPIRNPVQARDQIFNLSWQPAEEIRIAFAGIIDLDGDGLDNNEEFLRMLERQGVIVDEYLKLKPLDFVKRDGKGMSLQTRYLVIAENPRFDVPIGIGAESPQVRQMKEALSKLSDIRLRARELGVQVIEANKFLAMIGYKLPRNPAPPQYGASAYFQNAPKPMDEPKKDGN